MAGKAGVGAGEARCRAEVGVSAGEVAVWQWEGAKLSVSSHRAQWLQATLTVSL